jgi:hypothetical protein
MLHSLYPLLSQSAHSSSPIEASSRYTSSRRKQQQSNGPRGRENINEREDTLPLFLQIPESLPCNSCIVLGLFVNFKLFKVLFDLF